MRRQSQQTAGPLGSASAQQMNYYEPQPRHTHKKTSTMSTCKAKEVKGMSQLVAVYTIVGYFLCVCAIIGEYGAHDPYSTKKGNVTVVHKTPSGWFVSMDQLLQGGLISGIIAFYFAANKAIVGGTNMSLIWSNVFVIIADLVAGGLYIAGGVVFTSNSNKGKSFTITLGMIGAGLFIAACITAVIESVTRYKYKEEIDGDGKVNPTA